MLALRCAFVFFLWDEQSRWRSSRWLTSHHATHGSQADDLPLVWVVHRQYEASLAPCLEQTVELEETIRLLSHAWVGIRGHRRMKPRQDKGLVHDIWHLTKPSQGLLHIGVSLQARRDHKYMSGMQEVLRRW